MYIKVHLKGSEIFSNIKRMSILPKRRRSLATTIGNDGTGSTIDSTKQIRIVKTQSRLRMLMEHLPGGRRRLHLKGTTIPLPPFAKFRHLQVWIPLRFLLNYTN